MTITGSKLYQRGLTYSLGAAILIMCCSIEVNSNEHTYQKGYDYDSVTLTPESNVKQIAKAVTVKIMGAGSSGSGVLIRKVGSTYYVATAWHVVANNGAQEEIDIVTSDGAIHRTYGASSSQLGANDIAVIKFQSNRQYALARILPDIYSLNRDLNSRNTEGEAIGLGGFPLDGKGFEYSTGILVAYADIGIGDGYELLYTNKTSKGMSGGPIFNRSGFLIGIHGRGDRDEVARKNKGLSEDSKTAVNQGVPINYLDSEVKFGPLTLDEPERYLEVVRRASKYWGREQMALTMVDKLISRFPSSKAFLTRGRIHSDLFQLSSAISDFRKSIELDPGNYDAIYLLARSLYVDKKVTESWKYLVDLLQSNPPLRLVQPVAVLAADIKADQGEYTYSIEFAEQAIRLDPENDTGYLALGRSYEKQNQLNDALNAYSRHSGSLSAKLAEAKSKIFFAQAKYEMAWDEINKAITMHEMFGDKASNTRLERPSSAYAFRAVLQAMQGLCNRSRNDLKQAESLNRLNLFIKDSTEMVNKICRDAD